MSGHRCCTDSPCFRVIKLWANSGQKYVLATNSAFCRDLLLFTFCPSRLVVFGRKNCIMAATTAAAAPTATAQALASQAPVKKAGLDQEASFHRIRITLTSRNVARLEKGTLVHLVSHFIAISVYLSLFFLSFF
jgi:hypothetical protein